MTGNDPAASGGQYIHAPEGSGNVLQVAGNNNQASYCFTVATPGVYRLKGWVHSELYNDSFWVTVDGQPAAGSLWDIAHNTIYDWDYVNDYSTSTDPVEVSLGAGTHTLVIYQREDGARLDKFQVELVSGQATSTPTPTATATNDLIFADGFETGDFSAWLDGEADGGDLSVTGAAAFAGSYGMRAVVDDNTAIYAKDVTPTSETRYRARFYFDPNSIGMGSGNTHELLRGADASGNGVARLELTYSGGAYKVRTGSYNDGGSWASGNWQTISDAWHALEIEWQASSAAGANDGLLRLWLDGSQVSEQSGLDNDTRRVAEALLGAVGGIDNGTRGTYYFALRRSSSILRPPCLSSAVYRLPRLTPTSPDSTILWLWICSPDSTPNNNRRSSPAWAPSW